MGSPISHVQLRVADLDRSLAFYRDLLGFSVVKDEGQTLHLAPRAGDRDAGAPALLTLREVTGLSRRPRNPHTAGLYHVAWLVPNRAELGRALMGLHDRRYALTGAADHAVSESLYLDDPDGNGVEIYADRPRETWQWHDGRVHMTVDPMDVNDVASEAVRSGASGEWAGLPAETVIGHVHFTVSDLPSSVEWNQESLGTDVTFTMSSLVGLSVEGYHHHVNLNTWAGENAPSDDPNVAGLDHWTFNSREYSGHS